MLTAVKNSSGGINNLKTLKMDRKFPKIDFRGFVRTKVEVEI